MSRARKWGLNPSTRARPRHLHHHCRAGRREAAAAGRRLRPVQQPARPAHSGPPRRRVLRRPHPRGCRRPSGTSPGIACRSGRRAMCLRRASRSATSPAGSAAWPPAAATASRPMCRGRSSSPTRWPRQTSARRSAFRCIRRSCTRRARRWSSCSCCWPPNGAGGPLRAGRSGPTCSCTRFRASSSRSTAAIRAAPCSGSCRPRSSSPWSWRRSAWSCWSGCRETAPAGTESAARRRRVAA